MKKRFVCVAALVLAGILLCSGAMAQGGMKLRGSGGWGAGLPYNRLYDPATVQTLRGEVLKVDKLTPSEGMSDGLHLMLKTREETIPVHLGPMWYLERQEFSVEPGDRIEVVGSRVMFEGSSALIAAQVKKADKVLYLREESGFPLWSGWRRR